MAGPDLAAAGADALVGDGKIRVVSLQYLLAEYLAPVCSLQAIGGRDLVDIIVKLLRDLAASCTRLLDLAGRSTGARLLLRLADPLQALGGCLDENVLLDLRRTVSLALVSPEPLLPTCGDTAVTRLG